MEKPQWIVFSYVCVVYTVQCTTYTLHKQCDAKEEWMVGWNGWMNIKRGLMGGMNRWFTWDFVTVCAFEIREKTSISHWFDNICSNKCFITSRSYTKCKADLAVAVAAGFTALSQIYIRTTMFCCNTISYYYMNSIFNLITKINTHTHTVHPLSE